MCFVANAQDAEPVVLPTDAYSSNQIERHDFDTKKWEELKAGIDYFGDKQKKKTKKKEEPEAAPAKDDADFAKIFKIVSVVAAIGLLVFLFLKLADGKDLFGPRNSKLKPAVSDAELEKIEENLHEAELDDPIRRAVAAGDYPLAVRLYYLSVLKELANKGHIRWKRDKTNGAYLRELAGSPLFGTVQEVTLAFERVWYGKVALSDADFGQLEAKFKAAARTVGQTDISSNTHIKQ